ncbi:MAG: hypothetical protein KDB01_05630, partial [Planctomycetaceae bacterium]|nr:hypothetical protein [Planctomycetaceae bacterium]
QAGLPEGHASACIMRELLRDCGIREYQQPTRMQRSAEVRGDPPKREIAIQLLNLRDRRTELKIA